MLFNPAHETRFVRQANPAWNTPALSSDLVTCLRNCIPKTCRHGTRERVERLLAAGAATDAALTLIALELPGWQLRRLVYEDGEWFCSLSRQPDVPCDLDDTADARHEIAAQAIAAAFLEALCKSAQEPRSSLPPGLMMRRASGCVVCCDNFS